MTQKSLPWPSWCRLVPAIVGLGCGALALGAPPWHGKSETRRLDQSQPTSGRSAKGAVVERTLGAVAGVPVGTGLASFSGTAVIDPPDDVDNRVPVSMAGSMQESTGGPTGADVCSDATVVPVPVGPAGSPLTTTITGDNTGATAADCLTRPVWWEAFQIDQCATVTLDFCVTDPPRSPDFIFLFDACPCGAFLVFDAFARSCPNGNIEMTFHSLPAGTYYYPVLSDPELPNAIGPYLLTITAEACQGPTCCLGACCNRLTQSCADDVPATQCTAPDETFGFRQRCCEAECRHATPEFDASGVTLLSRVPVESFLGPSTHANEVWGYVSPSGREYALIGLECAMGFVEVTDPLNPVIIAEIAGPCSTWRDTAIVGEFAYTVIDDTGQGLQVIDLRDIDLGTVTLATTATPGGFQTAHNVAANPQTGFIYVVLSNINDGITALDVSKPTSPEVVGSWTNAFVHDVLVVSYASGPFAGREIAFASSIETGLEIVDVTDKSNMFARSTVGYPNLSVGHQGWLSEDRRYFFLGDEGDESDFGLPTTTYVMDVQNLDNASLLTSFTNGLCAIDHNMMVRGGRLFQANYTSGLRVFDISDVSGVTEIAHFDTHPEDNRTDFLGAWGVYSALPSGTILLSDIERGLFVLGVESSGACCDGFTGTCTDNVAEENCRGDGQTWFNDQTCAGVSCVEIPAGGDCVIDGNIDLLDYQALRNCLTGPADGPLKETCRCADFDTDDDVDLRDFGGFQVAFLGPGG